MKTIIAGSRSIEDADVVNNAIISAPFLVTEVVSGTARGVDKLGELYGELYDLPIHRFPAQWNKYGKSAGYLRNEEMADNADALIAIWDGKSRGTMHMITIARRKGLVVHIHKTMETEL